MRRGVGITIGAVLVSAIACGRVQIGEPNRRTVMEGALRQALAGSLPPYAAHDPEGRRLWQQTRAFYENRQYAAAWIENTKPRPQLAAFIAALRDAHHEGLDPELYSTSRLEQRRQEASKGFLSAKGFDPTEAGALDVWLTYLYLKYASDLADGLSDLARADRAWQIRPERFDARQHLEEALASNRIRESLLDLTPQAPEYQRLRAALAEHRDQAAKGGWPALPPLKLRPGQTSPQVPALAARLAASGDYGGTVPQAGRPSVYGPELVAALKRFQARHGLAQDGTVGPAVIAALNVPIEERIAQIELNLERWRWLPRDLGDRYILVNIPEMQLDVYEGDRVPLTMRVVVGKRDTQTPIFNDQMSYLVFSPYWNVPPSIAEGETLPAVMKDPGFLARNNMEIVDKAGRPLDPSTVDLEDRGSYRFRQRPGTDNSLGLVKFMFPNQFNVYLHDTPADSLFERSTRSFSHGCVRVEDPLALAEYVLRDQPQWTRERIGEAMHAGTETSVKLKTPIPVYLGYWTARVRPDGAVHFRQDVYGIDQRQTRMVADRRERLRKSGEAAAAVTTVAPTKHGPAPDARSQDAAQK